jgi:UDP-2,4-diacetamido-2,4,6-trideoxy-beta-L-altropyranose hydrolase
MIKQVIIRADATERIGTGHLMRCLALAQTLRAVGVDVTFISACKSKSLHQRLLDEGFQVALLDRPYPDTADWSATSRVLQSHPNAWVVLDGYHFEVFYQQSIKEAGHRLLVIDDTAHLNQYCCDILLNQNIHAEQLHYALGRDTRLLLGPRYALLRTEFLNRISWKRKTPDVARRLLVSLGGEDSDNQTLKVIQAVQLANIDGLEAMIVVGSANPHMPRLQTECRKSQTPIHLIHNALDMAELMSAADMVVSAGGSTCWELAFMGLPALVIILAENQRLVAEGLKETGIALNLGWYKSLSPSNISQALEKLAFRPNEREEMAERGRKLVDGKGTKRVLTEMTLK